MAGVAGATIANAGTGVQPVIGAYVQDSIFPRANTNYIGVNPKVAYNDNVLGQGQTNPFLTSPPQPNWIVPMDDNAVTGGVGQWVKSASALVPGDKVTIASGTATKDNAAGTHNVFATVAIGQFFWAPAVA